MELTAQNVQLDRGGRRLLEAVSVSVRAGEVTVLVGPNGAGKSSLLRVMAGLERPDRGVVTLDAEDIAAMPPARRVRLVAHLPQSTDIGWSVSGRDVVALGRLPHGGGLADGGDRSVHADAVSRAMQRTGTMEFADRRVDRLSQGERARLLLARVLAQETDVMLLDEPVASLDPAQALAMMEMLAVEAKQGRAVAVVMHDLVLAQRFAGRAVLLHDGRVLAQGEARDVFDESVLRAAYGVAMQRAEVDGVSLLIPWQRVEPAAPAGRP